MRFDHRPGSYIFGPGGAKRAESDEDIVKDYWIDHELDKGSFFHVYSPEPWYALYWGDSMIGG